MFDPACGSGNFLVIAYKELRRLEHAILERLAELEPHRAGAVRRVGDQHRELLRHRDRRLRHEIAILSLWLAKHQMNTEFKEKFGAEIPLIPLKETGQIACGQRRS